MITNYEKQYIQICEDILNNGYYSNNRTGEPTYKLPHQIMEIDLENMIISEERTFVHPQTLEEVLFFPNPLGPQNTATFYRYYRYKDCLYSHYTYKGYYLFRA